MAGSGAEVDQESAPAVRMELWNHLRVPNAMCIKEELETRTVTADNLTTKEEPTFSPVDWPMQQHTSQFPIKQEKDFYEDKHTISEQTVVDKPFPLVLYKVDTTLQTTAQSEIVVQADSPKRQLHTSLVKSDVMDTVNVGSFANFPQGANQEKKKETVKTGEPHRCNLCPYNSVRRGDLKRHVRIHTGEKPYKCKLCQHSCADQSNLKEHEKTHTGEKPYKCRLCQYSCAFRSNLNKHERTHTGEKPYKCKLCQYRCVQQSNLNKHQRTHTAEKPYQCKLCQYSCAQKNNLNRHERSHSGEKSFK